MPLQPAVRTRLNFSDYADNEPVVPHDEASNIVSEPTGGVPTSGPMPSGGHRPISTTEAVSNVGGSSVGDALLHRGE